MSALRFSRVVASLTVLASCSAGGGDEGDDAPPFTPSFGGAGSPSGASGASSAPVASAGAGGTGTTPVSAGAGGTLGGTPVANPPPAGGTSGEGNPNPTPIPTGGSGGSGGTPVGNPDPLEPPPAGGPFVSVDVDGGASAAFVCPEGATFGNPLAGMGAVTTVTAPSGDFFAFIEGPIWVGSLNRLFFSDNASSPERIFQLDPPFNTPSVFMPNSGSNGLALDTQDRLVLADEAVDRITRVDPTTGTLIDTLVPTGSHEPNDLIMRSDGNLYSTDPSKGFFRRSPTGEMSGPFRQGAVAEAPSNANGVVLSPDENTLYVGDVNQRFVAAFSLLADGAVDTTSGRRFVNTMNGTVDGMAVDCAGNVYVGTENNVEVYTASGTLIGTVPTGYSSNATFGGADRRTLFVTSRGELKFVTLGVPGLPD
jgi:gluconolactonase